MCYTRNWIKTRQTDISIGIFSWTSYLFLEAGACSLSRATLSKNSSVLGTDIACVETSLLSQMEVIVYFWNFINEVLSFNVFFFSQLSQGTPPSRTTAILAESSSPKASSLPTKKTSAKLGESFSISGNVFRHSCNQLQCVMYRLVCSVTRSRYLGIRAVFVNLRLL